MTSPAEPASVRTFLEADRDADLVAAAPAAVPELPADTVVEESAPVGFDPEDARLSATLPPGVAMLCVTETQWHGEPHFTLHFHHGGRVRGTVSAKDLAEQRPHGVSIAEIVARATAAGSGRDAGEEDKPWRDAYYEVMNAWRQMDTLVEWMRELVGGGADAQLVVWDNTRFEVPWELFRHEDENAWLGELIPVIRWTTVHDGARSWTYSAPEHASTGGVLMYEDKELAVPADRFHRYEVVPRKTTMGQLIRQLNDETVDFGLVVVRCHGKYSNDPRKMKLGGMPLNEFADVRMAALRRNRAPVLLNACVSARPVGVMPRSFAELFLRYGASAVIATVAEVGLNHSHEFAVRLLEKAEEGAVNIARALRDHRRAYAGPVRRDLGTDEDLRTEKDFELFFHGFMYVYFGHPGTTLRAIPQNGGACGGD